jgi:hypothetical protein
VTWGDYTEFLGGVKELRRVRKTKKRNSQRTQRAQSSRSREEQSRAEKRREEKRREGEPKTQAHTPCLGHPAEKSGEE